LSVNLSDQTTKSEDYDPDLLKKFIGGSGVGIKIVYDQVLPGTDAFDEENVIVFVTGPMTATAALSSGGYGVVTKSPVTHLVANSQANGFFGLRIKQAGYDFVVIRGKAKSPVYLWITQDKVELRDATGIWGMQCSRTQEKIKEEVGQKNASVCCIGPAGEALVKYALLNSDNGHVASSGGGGAVMGAKNLKAIAAYGKLKIPVADKVALNEAVREWRGYVEQSPVAQQLKAFGTGGAVELLYQMSDLPVKNLTTNIFPDYANISGQAIRNNHRTKVKPCYRCPINHVSTVEICEGPHKGLVMEEPEYEGCAGMGSNIGVGVTHDMLYLNHLTDEMGMDYKTLSFVISLCMECKTRTRKRPKSDGASLCRANLQYTTNSSQNVRAVSAARCNAWTFIRPRNLARAAAASFPATCIRNGPKTSCALTALHPWSALS